MTLRDFETMWSALADAIDDRESYLDSLHCHGKLSDGMEKPARNTRKLLDKYRKLRVKVGKEIEARRKGPF